MNTPTPRTDSATAQSRDKFELSVNMSCIERELIAAHEALKTCGSFHGSAEARIKELEEAITFFFTSLTNADHFKALDNLEKFAKRRTSP